MTFTSQNFGARKYDRCKKAFRLTMLSGIIFSGIMDIVFVAGRHWFIRLFSVDPSVIEYASARMMRVLLFEYLACSYEISGSALRGMGYSMTPAVLTVFGTCFVRIIWTFAVCNSRFRDYGLLMDVYLVTWIITGTMVLFAYFKIRKKVFSEYKS